MAVFVWAHTYRYINAELSFLSFITFYKQKGFLPLHVAAKHGNVRVARLLLARNGVDPNAVCDNDLTPLHVAVHSNQINTALLLLEKGAKPNCQAKVRHSSLCEI